MRRRILGLTLAVVGFAVLALALYTSSLPVMRESKNLTLEPSTGTFDQINLNTNDKVQGTLDVIEGPAGIRVYVEDPSLKVVYNGGTVYNDLDFSFNAQTSGVYRVNFENLSPTNQQTITYSLVFPAIRGIVWYVAIVAGALLVVVGLGVAIVLGRKH